MIAGVNGPAGPQRSFGDKAKDAYNQWFHKTPAVTRSMVFIGIAGIINDATTSIVYFLIGFAKAHCLHWLALMNI